LVYRQFAVQINNLTPAQQPDFNTQDNGVLYLCGPTGLIMEFDRFTNAGTNDPGRTFLYDPEGNCVSSTSGANYTDNGLFAFAAESPVLYDGYGVPVQMGWTTGGSNPLPTVTNRTTSQPFQYKGQYGCYTDGTSGLIYCQHRYYDPNTGRGTERDPTGLDGGVNVYAYCEGNPVMLIDPKGTDDYAIICGDSGNKANAMKLYYWDRIWSLRTDGVDSVIAEDHPDRVRLLDIFTSRLDCMEFWGHGNTLGLWFGPGNKDYMTVNQVRGMAGVRRSLGLPKLKYIKIDECCVCANHSMVNALLELADEVYGYEGETVNEDTWSLGILHCYTMPFKRPKRLPRAQDDIVDDNDPKNYSRWIFTRDLLPKKGHRK
jgi:RHS repeat-associated protein